MSSPEQVYLDWQKNAQVNQTQILRGPIRLVKISIANPEKIFYLFGDRHVFIEESCQDEKPIDEFLDSWLSTTPYFLDLILEFQHKPKQQNWNDLYAVSKESNQSYLVQTNFMTKTKSYKNVRIHYNDSRQGNVLYMDLIEAFENNDYSKVDNVMLRTWYDWIKILRNNSKVDKQLLYCSEGVRFVINWWLDKKIEEQYTILGSNNKKMADGDILMYNNNDNSRVLFKVGLYFVDSFTIARAFRTFNQHSDEYYDPMKNIVIFTGDHHTSNYIEILTTLDGHIDQYVEDETQCIDLKSFIPLEMLKTEVDKNNNDQYEREWNYLSLM